MSQILLTDVRKKFLEFLKKTIIRLLTLVILVPNNDPTLCLLIQEWSNLKMFLQD